MIDRLITHKVVLFDRSPKKDPLLVKLEGKVQDGREDKDAAPFQHWNGCRHCSSPNSSQWSLSTRIAIRNLFK